MSPRASSRAAADSTSRLQCIMGSTALPHAARRADKFHRAPHGQSAPRGRPRAAARARRLCQATTRGRGGRGSQRGARARCAVVPANAAAAHKGAVATGGKAELLGKFKVRAIAACIAAPRIAFLEARETARVLWVAARAAFKGKGLR
jgi:hypothetical protein